MYVKMLNNKKGGSNKGIDYLLDKKRVADQTAKILKGDEQITRSIVANISKKQKLTIGTLSFEEPNITQKQKETIIEDFEKTLLPGLEPEQYNILWVEHTDKGRLELNFAIPKVELTTQKALQPYYHKQDFARIDMFEDKYNILYNLSSKKDPSKKQTLENDNRIGIIKDYKALDEKLTQLVMSGKIQNRQQMIETLKSSNIEVTRQGKESISVKLPDSKRARKLKQGIYSEQFTSHPRLRTISERARAEVEKYNSRDTSKELERISDRLPRYNERKAHINRNLYDKEHEKHREQDNEREQDSTWEHRLRTKESEKEAILSVRNNSDNQHDNSNISNAEISPKPEMVSTKRATITERERQIYDESERRLDIQRQDSRPRQQDIEIEGLENDIARRALDRIREEQEQRKRAYEQARHARTELYNANIKQSKELRERFKHDSNELRKEAPRGSAQQREIFEYISKESEIFIKTAREHHERVSEDTTSFSWIERFKERFSEFREQFKNTLASARQGLKDTFNYYIDAFNELDFKLESTGEVLEKNSNENKKELTVKDVDEVVIAVENNIIYNQEKLEEQQQNRSTSRSYGMSL